MFAVIKKAKDPRGLLRKLRRRGTVDPLAVAFILTEQAFRGPVFRVAELFYGAFCVYVLRRDPIVTLGHCQVSFAYWRDRYGKDNASLFFATLSDVASYEVCCAYLEANRKANVVEMVIGYNGKPSALYAQLFFENLTLVTECLRDFALPHGLQGAPEMATEKLRN